MGCSTRAPTAGTRCAVPRRATRRTSCAPTTGGPSTSAATSSVGRACTNLYSDAIDLSEHGLRQVAQVDSYHDFVFATTDRSAPALADYLGETGRLGLDLIAAQGDMELIPGIQKFTIPCNWKFAVDNLFDWYHPHVTHLSALQTGLLGGQRPAEPRDGLWRRPHSRRRGDPASGRRRRWRRDGLHRVRGHLWPRDRRPDRGCLRWREPCSTTAGVRANVPGRCSVPSAPRSPGTRTSSVTVGVEHHAGVPADPARSDGDGDLVVQLRRPGIVPEGAVPQQVIAVPLCGTVEGQRSGATPPVRTSPAPR